MNDFILELKDKLKNFKTLDKENLNNVINQVKKIKITREILKETELHKDLVNIIKFYHSNEKYNKIVEKSNKIRKNWKEFLINQKDNKNCEPNQNNENKINDNNLKEEEKKNDETNIIEDKQFNRKLDNQDRNTSAKQFYDKFLKHLNNNNSIKELYIDKIEKLSYDIESQIWELNDLNIREYKRYLRQRVLVLADKNNINLLNDLLLGTLDISKFCKTDLKDLIDPKLREKEIEDKKWSMTAMQSDFYVKNQVVKEGEFVCFNCKSKKIFTTQKQMRSADEPMTTFFSCQQCGNIWKMN